MSSFLVFVLVVNSGDPLANLRNDTSPERDTKIARRIAILHLDEPVPQRYLKWLRGVTGCVVPGRDCDLGTTVNDQSVTALVSEALGATLRLVTAALVLAIVLGVAAGLVSALRQYSGFDHTVSFTAFLFFSLPLFWVAVLLKQYLAIGANNWFAEPRIGLASALAVAAVTGGAAGALVGGDRRRRWLARVTAGGLTATILVQLSREDWFRRPALGQAGIAVLSLGSALGIAYLSAGLGRRAVLVSCLATATEGCLAQVVVTPWLQDPLWASWTNVLLLLLVALLAAAVTGVALGAQDRGTAVRASMVTAAATGAFILIDILLRAVPGYAALVNGRIIATIGSQTPEFAGGFWEQQLDILAHLLLPTLAVTLVTFASYSRYSRGTMLEAMSQDYVRTARSKGLPERVVVVRHALRNALIPLTTVAAMDVGALLGGAVITEHVFGWRGMGTLFLGGLLQVDPNPVMGFFLVTVVAVIALNLVADLAYALLDPRIRL
ncbi:MAG TPA: ABC transporter permease [Kineosporiaceae bacterium]